MRKSESFLLGVAFAFALVNLMATLFLVATKGGVR